MVLLTLRVDFPCPGEPLWIHPHGYTRKCVSKVMPNPVKSTIKKYYYHRVLKLFFLNCSLYFYSPFCLVTGGHRIGVGLFVCFEGRGKVFWMKTWGLRIPRTVAAQGHTWVMSGFYFFRSAPSSHSWSLRIVRCRRKTMDTITQPTFSVKAFGP